MNELIEQAAAAINESSLAPVSLLDGDSTIKEIVRRYANQMPSQSDFEASYEWHIKVESVMTRACYEYAESLRVPQYDSELNLAEAEIAKWKELARRLYIARGCKKNEHLRIQAEAAYLNAANAGAKTRP